MEQVKRAAQQGAKRFVKSELGRRVLGSPGFQAAVMKAITTRAKVRQQVTAHVQAAAKTHKLVTKAEMAQLKRTIRELEATVAQLQRDMERAPTDRDTST